MTAMSAESRSERYVDAAVRAELDELANTSSGRNAALNKAAHALGGFVAAGALSEDQAYQSLCDACETNGYSRKDGWASVRATIRSGLRKGKQSPRTLPTDLTRVEHQRATVAAFAEARCIPVQALTHMGWRDTPAGIEILYTRRDGTPGRTRVRGTMNGERRFYWAGQGDIIAYEPDRTVQSADLIICEGESDTVTLSYAGLRAVGVPGACMTRVIQAEHLEGVQRVYIAVDTDTTGKPDAGAVEFVPGVRARLKSLGFTGTVLDLPLEGAKDFSSLWVRDPNVPAFKAAVLAATALAELRAPASQQTSDPPRPAYLTLAESASQCLRPIGQRLETGFPSLDRATRGGIPLGRVLVAAGAPGAGKTGVSVQLCDRFESQGAAVVYLASDEPAEGIITRFGQLAGFSRDGLESEGDAGDAIRAGFAKHSAERAIAVIDPDAHESMATIEDAETALMHMAGNRPRVLVVDSLQTARCKAADAAESTRERIDAKLGVLKAIAKRGTLVVAISEMARSGYRTGDRQTDTSALAAGKESGSIEYGAALLIGLRSVKDEQGQVDVEVAKNRLGGFKPEFRLQLDFERACFTEIAMPDPEERRRGAEELRMAHARDRVLSAVRTDHELQSGNAVSRAAGGTKADNLLAIRELLDKGTLVKVDGCFRVALPSAERGAT